MYKLEDFIKKTFYFQDEDPEENSKNFIETYDLWVKKTDNHNSYLRKNYIKFELFYWKDGFHYHDWMHFDYLKKVDDVKKFLIGTPGCKLEDVDFPYIYKKYLPSMYKDYHCKHNNDGFSDDAFFIDCINELIKNLNYKLGENE